MGEDTTAGKSVRHNRSFLHSTFGHVVIGILAAFIVGVGVWGAMTVSGNRNMAAASEQSAKDLADARARLAVETRNGDIREAQTFLYQAAIELERRNFGTANTRVKDAGKALAALPGADSDARVANLQQAIAGVDLTVVTDVSAQRNQILELAQQAGGLVSAG